jgi:hypothetical protein
MSCGFYQPAFRWGWGIIEVQEMRNEAWNKLIPRRVHYYEEEWSIVSTNQHKNWNGKAPGILGNLLTGAGTPSSPGFALSAVSLKPLRVRTFSVFAISL